MEKQLFQKFVGDSIEKQLRLVFFSGVILLSITLVSHEKAFGQKLSAREIAQRTLQSTVSVVMKDEKTNQIRSGSGFFVAEDIVVTNYHVIENANEGIAKIVGQDKIYEVIGTVGVDEQNDLALIKLRGSKGKPLKINTDDSTIIGDDVYAVGNPQGLEGTFSQGIVSSIRKTEKISLLQITAPISEGSSGGAVLNDLGEVVGIAVGGIEKGQSLNFAVPVRFLRLLVSIQKPLQSLDNKKVSNDGTQSGSRVVPRQTERLPSTGPSPKRQSQIQHKVVDSEEENLFGSLNLVKETIYAPSQKFDKWELGKPVATSTKKYNLDGNFDYVDSVIYTDEGVSETDFMLYFFTEKIDGEDLKPPAKFKSLYFYDYANNFVTYEIYVKCNPCSGFELINKIAVKYGEGEESRFHPDGKLFLKTITRNNGKGSVIKETYYGEGNLSHKEITYKNSTGEIKEYWLPSKLNKGQVELSSKTITTETRDQIKETYICVKEKDDVCGRTTITDKATKLTRRLEYGTDVFKYDYEVDSRGNWIKKTESKLVSKFGKSFFEPRKVVVRELTYY